MHLSDYSYLALPEKTGHLETDIRNLLEQNGKGATYAHVSSVSEASARLAASGSVTFTNIGSQPMAVALKTGQAHSTSSGTSSTATSRSRSAIRAERDLTSTFTAP